MAVLASMRVAKVVDFSSRAVAPGEGPAGADVGPRRLTAHASCAGMAVAEGRTERRTADRTTEGGRPVVCDGMDVSLTIFAFRSVLWEFLSRVTHVARVWILHSWCFAVPWFLGGGNLS